jgi:methionyl aminopeptidase
MASVRDYPTPKTDRELDKMRVAGRMVADVLALMKDMVKPGVTTRELNEAAHAKMLEMGGKPSFLNYRGYPAVLCISVDDEVVHGIPGGVQFPIGKGPITPDRGLEAGSIVSIDCGVIHDGWHGDSAVTLPVGEISADLQRLLDVTRGALWAGIKAVREGAMLSDIAAAIEGHVRANDLPDGEYGIVEEYVGHGIGRKLHEPPQIPNYVSADLLRKNNYKLSKGYVIALEPMVNLGTKATRVLGDGWTVVTKDKKPSAHFEHTVAVTGNGFEVLTLRADGSATH